MAKRTGLRRPEKKRRGFVWLWLSLLVLLLFIWSLTEQSGFLQGIKGIFDRGNQGIETGSAIRGTIYDRNYKELAVSLERVSVYVRTREIEGAEAVAGKLAPVLETDEGRLLETLKEGEQRIWLVNDISQEQEDKIRELNLPGVYLHKDYSRFYPQKTDAAHIVGFAENGIGLAGIEYYYDRLIGEVLAEENGGYSGSGGQDLLLTLDLKIQVLFEELIRQLSKGRLKSEIGIYAMDAQDGALVGAAQYPSFNPNTYRIYSQEVLESLLVKPVVLPSKFRTLFRESATLKSQYDARGTVLPWCISKSDQSLGTELRLWESLGLDRRPSEEFVIVSGQPAKPRYRLIEKSHNLGTAPEMMTPLNLMAGLSELMNGGFKVTPHVAGSVVDSRSGQEVEIRSTENREPGKAVLMGEVSKEFSELFIGTAAKDELGGARIDDSARCLIENNGFWELAANSLYFIALPVHDAELVILLTIQEKGYEVEKENTEKLIQPAAALASVLPRIAVLQQVGKGLHGVAEPEAGASGNFPASLDSIRNALKESLVSDIPADKSVERMPDVVGLSLRKSLRMLQGKKCRIRVYGSGQVISQEPPAGTELTESIECVLKLRQGDVSIETYEKKVLN